MDWLEILQPAISGSSRTPMYRRITDCLRTSIESGALIEEQRLPPDRELARLLKVDRSTVARAYDLLEQTGLVHSHVGRGTFVRHAAAAPAPKAEFNNESIIWSDKFSRASEIISSIVQRQPAPVSDPGVISFAAGAPTEEFFPARDFQDIVSSLLASSRSADLFGYTQPEGHPALREQVCNYLRQQGMEVRDDELLILSGSQQGIDLVARTLVDPDDVVLMEDPTYFWAISTFTSNGARCLPVPTGEQGIKLDAFDSVASRTNAKLLYCMPSFHNPTGSTMSTERRKRLLELARRHQVPILEDNYAGDLCYTAHAEPALRSLDGTAGNVIYQGTFSKALCPGLRLGWLVASQPVMNRLRLAKRTCDLSTNSMAQMILAEYLRRGLYTTHLETVQHAYSERLETMSASLSKECREYLTWQRPAGGMFIWAKLPPGYSCRELLAFAQREGVSYSPGDVYFLNGSSNEYLRLNFIQQTCDQIEEGIRRLSRALHAYAERRRQRVNRSRDGALIVAESTFI